jgi:hypothetical protein
MKARWALVLLGVWLTGTICVSVVATQNFYTVDRLLAKRATPVFNTIVDREGQSRTRDLLRYLSSELNRLYFQLWNGTQVILGWLVVWLVAGQRRPIRWLVGAMVMATVAVAAMTPQIVSLGRSLDFVPRDPAPPGMSRFWILHGAYTSIEMIKLAIGAVATILLVQETPPTRSAAPPAGPPRPPGARASRSPAGPPPGARASSRQS